MKVSEVYDYSVSDPILNTFRTFGQLNCVSVSGGVVIAPEHAYAETIVNKARDLTSDLILIPWSETGGMSEHQILLLDDTTEKFSSGLHSTFISNILKNTRTNVGIFINKGFGGPSLSRPHPGMLSRSVSGSSVYRTNDMTLAPALDQGHHIFFPYFGGPDDRFALRLVLQLAKSTGITATIAHVNLPTSVLATTQQERETDTIFFTSIRDSLPPTLAPRVVFQTLNSAASDPVAVVAEAAKSDVGRSKENSGDLVVVSRNSIPIAANLGLASSSSGEIGPEARKALGVVGEAMVARTRGIRASVLVVQAGQEG